LITTLEQRSEHDLLPTKAHAKQEEMGEEQEEEEDENDKVYEGDEEDEEEEEEEKDKMNVSCVHAFNDPPTRAGGCR
jgi:hypothetical protein